MSLDDATIELLGINIHTAFTPQHERRSTVSYYPIIFFRTAFHAVTQRWHPRDSKAPTPRTNRLRLRVQVQLSKAAHSPMRVDVTGTLVRRHPHSFQQNAASTLVEEGIRE
jgi:hypothetical protein